MRDCLIIRSTLDRRSHTKQGLWLAQNENEKENCELNGGSTSLKGGHGKACRSETVDQ